MLYTSFHLVPVKIQGREILNATGRTHKLISVAPDSLPLPNPDLTSWIRQFEEPRANVGGSDSLRLRFDIIVDHEMSQNRLELCSGKEPVANHFLLRNMVSLVERHTVQDMHGAHGRRQDIRRM